MLKIIKKILLPIIFWCIFTVVIFKIPYPQSLIQANIYQLLLFFIPLLIAIGFTVNAFIKNAYSSFSISLGIISLLILKAIDSLNLVTAILIIITFGLLVSYFRKMKHKNLTKLPKIPKLTHLRKQKVSS